MTLGRTIAAIALFGLVGSCGDDYDFDSTGACVSDPVHLQFSSHVYCYDGWDRSDCTANDVDEVNGAEWSFHAYKDCWELDLSSGSNPYDGAPTRTGGGSDNGSGGGGSDGGDVACLQSYAECADICVKAGYNAFVDECSNNGQTCLCTSTSCGGCVELCTDNGYSGFEGYCRPDSTGDSCYCSDVCDGCADVCQQAGQEFSGTCTEATCFCD